MPRHSSSEPAPTPDLRWPILFAHRGAMALAPENTLEAFRLGVALGATGLESDVHLAEGGTPVLVHDPVLPVAGGEIVVRRTSVERLRAIGVPTLADLYRACGTALPLSLDLNDERALETAEAVVSIARAAGPPAVARLMLCHGDLTLLEEIRRRIPDVILVHSADRAEIGDLVSHVRRLVAAGIRVLNLHHSEWTGSGPTATAIAAVHEAGCSAFAWDTQDLATARALLGAGADAVYADDPRVLVGAVSGRTGEAP